MKKMPAITLKLTLSASLAIALLSGCGSPPRPDAPPASEETAPKSKAESAGATEKGGRAPGGAPRKALAAGRGVWSAPVPASPARSLSSLREILKKSPSAPGTDRVLLDIAKHELRRGSLQAAVENLKRLQEKFSLSPLYSESAFYLGLTLQASGRHQQAWISLRSSLSGETDPERRALLEASLGATYEKRGDAFPALLSYARAIAGDSQIYRKNALLERIEKLAEKIPAHQLRAAAGRFASAPTGPRLRVALARRSGRKKRPGASRDDPPDGAKTPDAKSAAREPEARPAIHAGRVGIMLPLSGPAASAGARVYQGIQVALRHSLAQRPDLRIQLAVRDTKSAAQSAGEAARLAIELITKEKVVALLGPLLTGATESAAEISNRLETPLLTPFAARMSMNREFAWIFRNSLTNRQQAQGAAAYAVRRLGVRRFAVLRPDNRDGEEMTDAFARTAENLGGEVVKIVSFPESANDFGAQMRALGGMDDRQLAREKLSLGLDKSALLETRPDFEALFVPARHDKAVLIAPQLPFYNVRGVRLLGGSGWNSPRLIERGERYVEGAVFVVGFFADSEDPKIARFSSAYENRFGRKPDLFSALGYDAARIIFSAIARGARTREQVREYLAALKGFEGVTGRTDMGADGDARRELFALSVRERKIRLIGTVAPREASDGGAIEQTRN